MGGASQLELLRRQIHLPCYTRRLQEKRRNERCSFTATNPEADVSCRLSDPARSTDIMLFSERIREATKLTRSGSLGRPDGQGARHTAWQGQLAGATTDTSPSHVCVSLLLLPVRAVHGSWCWRSFRSARPGVTSPLSRVSGGVQSPENGALCLFLPCYCGVACFALFLSAALCSC